jgi:peptidoglycan/xylan/chitin deacetylase (PgdA/CDA1 family)
LKKILKGFLNLNNRIIVIKRVIIFSLVLIFGGMTAYDSQKRVQNVLVFNETEDDKNMRNSNYVIEVLSKIENTDAIVDDFKLDEVDFEELKTAQEEIKLSPEEAVNTFAAGREFTVKAEEAFSFGRSEGKKYAFLTFDDGPSANITPRVLDTLKKNEVKATFFVLGRSVHENPKMLKRELEEGHAIANHTYYHDYKKIYPNKSIDVNVFKEELEKNQQAVNTASETAMNMRVIRFPAGSFEAWKGPMKKDLIEKGMYYIDWNVENGDGLKANIPVSEQLDNIKTQVSWAESAKKNVVILMHDAPAKATTAEALPQIIQYLKSKGYEFKTLR